MVLTKNTDGLTVSIVIPNWNGVYLMEKHLKTVLDAAQGVEIIVADDKSTDGSVEYLKTQFPKIKVVQRDSRGGFGANVNAGVAAAKGEIIILLNTDVEPEKEFLLPLLTHFRDPQVFAVGCLEKSLENGKTFLRGRGVAHWVKGYFIHSRGEVDKTDTAWVSGGSGAFRKSIWDKLGGMDTLYNPFYWEDIDLSYRGRKAGWRTLFEPKSIVHHYHEEGKIKREFTQMDVKRIVYRNQFIFIWKNLTDSHEILLHVLWTPIRLLQALISGDSLMLQGYIFALAKIPSIINHRLYQSKIFSKTDRELNI
jgi:GT2 family glycosyltransferase